MERDAQRAVRRITDHQEIVKQYQKVVRAYNNYMRGHPWMTEGLMQDNCRFGDLLKDEKRKSQFKYELGRLMGEYAVPLPLGNFSLNNKETRRLELWKNHRGMWFDHVEHMEEHVFNKKLITGSVRTANGVHMKMLCEGDINVDVITKNGDVTSGTLRVKVIPGMKQKLFSFTQAMMGGWTMQGGQTKQGELFIALTHEDHKTIIFDRVLKAGNSVLLPAKMVIKNPEEVNAVIVNGKQSKEYCHRVTGHAGHHLMDATAKYYKVNLTGKVNNCLSCSLEKIRQKNIPKKNEDKSKNPGERMYLDISSMRKPSMGGRQHWVMLVDEATKYKKSFFLKKKNEQVEPIIDWIKALKARHKIQVKIIWCDNAGENKVLERESDKNELGIIFEYTAPGTPQKN